MFITILFLFSNEKLNKNEIADNLMAAKYML